MKGLILCNGQPPSNALFKTCRQWADLFIAADGGANVATKLGGVPDVVIGDLDSYEPIDDFSGEVIHDPDQYSNDLEKALKFAQNKGINTVKVLGATGCRLDHTLKNLSVMKQFDEYFSKITFWDDYIVTKLLPEHYSAEIAEGTPVSLFPLSGKVTCVTSKGLKYELNEDILENGRFDGSSNTVTESPIAINHEEGDLLLFIAHDKG